MKKMKRANKSRGKEFYDSQQKEHQIECQSLEELHRKPGTESSCLGS